MSSTTSQASKSRLRQILPNSKPKGAAAVVGAAAAAGLAFAAYRKYSRKGTVSTFHVQPTDDGWKLQRDGASEPEQEFSTKTEAVDAGRRLAHREEPSELLVYRTDGTVERQHSYGATN